MDLMANEYLRQMAIHEKRFDAMYQKAGAGFSLPDCSMRVLYFLIFSVEPITQQDLIEEMMFPEQTISSSVMKYAREHRHQRI